MDCNHEQVRCTNNVFYCLKCGIEVPSPYQMDDKQSTEKKTAQEAGKRAVKRRTRKGESK